MCIHHSLLLHSDTACALSPVHDILVHMWEYNECQSECEDVTSMLNKQGH